MNAKFKTHKIILSIRLWCWEGLEAGGEGDDRGWDGWMASLIRWTWVWVNSGSWWWTGRPGVLQFMGSQRVGHDWATKLNWRRILRNKYDEIDKNNGMWLLKLWSLFLTSSLRTRNSNNFHHPCMQSIGKVFICWEHVYVSFCQTNFYPSSSPGNKYCTA